MKFPVVFTQGRRPLASGRDRAALYYSGRELSSTVNRGTLVGEERSYSDGPPPLGIDS